MLCGESEAVTAGPHFYSKLFLRSMLSFPSERGGVEKKLLCSLVESLCNTVASRRAAINLHRPVSKITTSPGRYHSVPTPGIAQVSPDSCTYVLGVTLVHCGQWRSGRHLVCFIGRSAMRRAGQSKSRHGAVREGERRLCSSLHPL